MPETTRELRLGICGPVGTGKSSLIMLLCARLGHELEIGVVTNDIYTDEVGAEQHDERGLAGADGATDAQPELVWTFRHGTTSWW